MKSFLTISLFLFLLFRGQTSGFSQEEIRIDESTVKVVKSPWQLQTVGTDASLRGLHVYDTNIMWASGSAGTVANTFDGGKKWRLITIKGAEELDVRDIHAIDEATVIAMTSGTPARIYRSTNAGISWKQVFETKNKQVFFDSISFWDDRNGVVMSDPVNGVLILLKTTDGGLTWKVVTQTPKLAAGEAGFAASGTNMTTIGKRKLIIGLGGAQPNETGQRSRVLLSDDYMRTWKAAAVPIPRTASAGIFSLAFANADDGIAIGGDYKNPDATTDNFALTSDGGASWSVPKDRKPPSGYRSCVAVWMNGKEVNYVAVGTNGTDLSTDLGKSWTRISNEGFHAVQFSPDKKTGWATGGDGRIAKWDGAFRKTQTKTPNR